MAWYEILIVIAAVAVVLGVIGSAIYKKVTGKGGGCAGCSDCCHCNGCPQCSRKREEQKDKE